MPECRIEITGQTEVTSNVKLVESLIQLFGIAMISGIFFFSALLHLISTH